MIYQRWVSTHRRVSIQALSPEGTMGIRMNECGVFGRDGEQEHVGMCELGIGKSLELRREECGVFGRDGKPDCRSLDLNLCRMNRKGAKVAKVV